MYNEKFKHHTTRELVDNLNKLINVMSELTEFSVTEDIGREDIKPLLTRVGVVLVQHSHELNYRVNQLYVDDSTEVQDVSS